MSPIFVDRYTNKYDRLQAQGQIDKTKLPEKIEKDAAKDYNNLSAEDKAKYTDFSDYYNQNNDYYYYAAVNYQVNENRKNGNNAGGIGSSMNKGIDAASSIVVGIITGDITGGLAGASAPYLAEQIKLATGHKNPATGKWETDDYTANLIAHAILGGAVAAAQGNSALAGAGGAAGGEAIAKIIRQELYGNKSVEDLTEAEKQNISNLTQLAIGLATAASGGSINDAGTAIAGGKNAVENNNLARAGWYLVRPSTIGAPVTISALDVLVAKGVSVAESEAFFNSLTFEQKTLIRLALVDPTPIQFEEKMI